MIWSFDSVPIRNAPTLRMTAGWEVATSAQDATAEEACLAHSRRFSASAFVNTPAIRVPQFAQQPFFSRFDITECQERVMTICLHPGQIVFAPSE